MKKILVLALAIVMALSVVALVACDNGETVTGECKYSTQWGGYGCKVDVTVKGDVITAVKLYTDEEAGEGFVRTTKSWLSEKEAEEWNAANPGETAKHGAGLGYKAAEAAYADWINKTFVGKTVAEVNAYVASATAEGQSVGTASANLAGATQSSARIIVAVKDALSKLAK